jgi:transmembrane sensor
MTRIVYLLQRYLDRKETAQERAELMALIASGKYRDVVEDVFARQVKRSLRERGDSVEALIESDLREIRGRLPIAEKEAKEVKLFPWYRVAAAVLVIAAAFVMWRYSAFTPQVLTSEFITQSSSVTASEGITKVILADGSLVWLKGASTLSYPDLFTGPSRRVTLHGEALFEVAKDASRPFIIQSGALTTTVLGTSFNIKTTDDDVEVVVLTGKVSLSTEDETQSLLVMPNEKAVYNGAARVLAKVEQVAVEEEKDMILAGTEYSMAFEDVRMDEIIERVQNKFNVDVSFSDPRLANCRVTADLTDQSLESTLMLVSKALSLEYEIRGSKVRLAGNGCDF